MIELLRRNLRWQIIAVIFVGTVQNYLARNSPGVLSVALFRGKLGMSEAAVIPAGVKASTEWFAPRERSMAIG